VNQRHTGTIPLIGAILVAEGPLTNEQLEAGLLLQKQDHPDQALGEILVRCGYITHAQLSRALSAQQELRASIVNAVGQHAPPPADLAALVIAPAADRLFARHLLSLGVDAFYAGTAANTQKLLASMHPDLLLVDPRSIAMVADLPQRSDGLLAVLPLPLDAWHDEHAEVAQAHAVLDRYISQAREYATRRRSHEDLRQREFEIHIIETLLREVSAAPTQSALSVLMTITRDAIGVQAGTLFQLDHQAHELISVVALGPAQNPLQPRRQPLERGITGWVARHGEPLLLPEASRDPRFDAAVDRCSGFETRSVLCIPLRAHGEIWGVLQLINKIGGAFTKRDLQILRVVGAIGGLLQEFDARYGGESETCPLHALMPFAGIAA
jgi:putative methionine-R-sulfoxide reductase with GAF domain